MAGSNALRIALGAGAGVAILGAAVLVEPMLRPRDAVPPAGQVAVTAPVPAEPAPDPADAAQVAVAAPQAEAEAVAVPEAEVVIPAAVPPTPPVIDVVRIAPDGTGIIAGKAPAGMAVAVLLGTDTLAEAVADASGSFVAFVTLPPSDTPRILSLLADPAGAAVPSEATVIVAPSPPPEPQTETVVASVAEPQSPETQPEAPEIAEAVTTEPAPTEPAPTEPAPTEPAPTEPAPTEPAPTEPAPTEPAPTEPAPTEPQSTEPASLAPEAAPQIALADVAEPVATPPVTADQNPQAESSPPSPTAEASDTAAPTTADLPASEPPVAAPEIAQTATPTPAPATATEASQDVAATPTAPVLTTDVTPQALADQPVADPAPQAESATVAAVDPAPSARVPQNPPELLDTLPALQPPAPDAPGIAPVLRMDEAGVRVLQPAIAPGASPEVLATVALDAIAYDDAGEVRLSGRAAGGGTVRVYIDNRPVIEVPVEANGQWTSGLPDVATGVYTMRVDQLDAAGSVISRIETPFQREERATIAAAMGEQTNAPDFTVAVKTVQPGATLWAIARDRYGDGVMYVQVFEANRDRIRNPDLIYPGQVFVLPEVVAQ